MAKGKSSFLEREVRVVIKLDMDTEVVGYFPPWSDPELQKGAKRLRMAGVGARSPKAVTVEREEARERFFRDHCRRVVIIEDGEAETLSGEGDWHAAVFPTWRVNMVGYFEDRQALTERDQGN